jgi:hypothetical protein
MIGGANRIMQEGSSFSSRTAKMSTTTTPERGYAYIRIRRQQREVLLCDLVLSVSFYEALRPTLNKSHRQQTWTKKQRDDYEADKRVCERKRLQLLARLEGLAVVDFPDEGACHTQRIGMDVLKSRWIPVRGARDWITTKLWQDEQFTLVCALDQFDWVALEKSVCPDMDVDEQPPSKKQRTEPCVKPGPVIESLVFTEDDFN